MVLLLRFEKASLPQVKVSVDRQVRQLAGRLLLARQLIIICTL